jgi:hypothetical protein
MNIFKIIILTVLLALIGVVHAAKGADAEVADSDTPGGMELLKKDQALIDELQAKLKESGGNTVIQELLTLAEEMKELNNQRHQMHEATKQYDKAFGIFSKGIEKIIDKVNQVLTAQADEAIKNAKVMDIMTGGQQKQK